jgi:hypothetical protein
MAAKGSRCITIRRACRYASRSFRPGRGQTYVPCLSALAKRKLTPDAARPTELTVYCYRDDRTGTRYDPLVMFSRLHELCNRVESVAWPINLRASRTRLLALSRRRMPVCSDAWSPAFMTSALRNVGLTSSTDDQSWLPSNTPAACSRRSCATPSSSTRVNALAQRRPHERNGWIMREGCEDARSHTLRLTDEGVKCSFPGRAALAQCPGRSRELLGKGGIDAVHAHVSKRLRGF